MPGNGSFHVWYRVVENQARLSGAGLSSRPFFLLRGRWCNRLFYGFSEPSFPSIGGANEQSDTGPFRAFPAFPGRVLFVPAGTRRALPRPEGAILRPLAFAQGNPAPRA